MSDAPKVLKPQQQVLIADATLTQMRDFAAEIGVTIKPHTPKNVVAKQIKGAGWDFEYITIDDEDAEDARASKAPSSKAPVTKMPEPMVLLQLANQDGAGGKVPKPVAVNGVVILIPRNQKCEVKLRYLEALAIAIETAVTDEMNPATGQLDRTYSDAPTVPYQVIRMPSQGEIDRWRAYERTQPEWHNAYPQGTPAG